MYEEELRRIIDASQNNALTFFVGAGVSCLSGAPSWKTLIDAICDKIGYDKKDEYSSDEYLKIPQIYYYSLSDNREEYFSFVKTQVEQKNISPNSVHREMLKLNPVSFVTTNYDTLLEDSAIQYCHSYKVISCDNDVPTIYGDKFILKLHGDFKNNNFVLKEEDYLNYSDSFKLIETLAKSIFSTNTVVFVGYGLNDYNIKLMLNWTKSLLKDNFRKPIFIYTGDSVLSSEELLYHESKGISVIEYYNIIPRTDNYNERYQSVFKALDKVSKITLDEKSEDEAFEFLYNLLQPLDKLNALRIEDVSKKLSPYTRISSNGVISYSQNNNLILKKFLTINQSSENKRRALNQEMLDKHKCILSVFIKARIMAIENDDNSVQYLTQNGIPFGDLNCISFNYRKMFSFASKEYKSLKSNYKKAYYLSRLRQYEKAFFLFSNIAKESFEVKDYLLYYLAESNCISLRKIIENPIFLNRSIDSDAIEDLSLNDLEVENLFRDLPVEFRKKYENLKNFHSVDALYKYSYEAFIDGQKLQNAVDSNSVEFGLTSSEKVMCRINDYLHFFLGNGIVADVFNEYKNTIKNLMSLLIYKYSAQSKNTLQDNSFGSFSNEKINFDNIDFYCFISCFNDKEIVKLVNKHHIETIEFQKMNLIEIAVNNLIDYYLFVIKTSKISLEIFDLQIKIKTCCALLRYVNISQKLVDKISLFILSHEFREIRINDKIMFLDYQVFHRKKYSTTTRKIVENTLISYMDKHIQALENGNEFDLPSTASNMNYHNLIHYICPDNNDFYSRKISSRLLRIMKGRLKSFYPQIHNYCSYITKSQKKALISTARIILNDAFDFDIFTLLIHCNAKIDNNLIEQLKIALWEEVKNAKKEDPIPVQIFPKQNPYEKLEQIGYWCFINSLNKKSFLEFLGNSSTFDFYLQYTEFDFNRFDVSRLIFLYPHALKKIAENENVKEKIRNRIILKLCNENIVDCDADKLQKILMDYFC